MEPFTSFLNNVVGNPSYYIGCVLSAFAVLAFLISLRGFIAGVGHVFADDGHIEHQEEAYVRVVWGTLLLLFVFILWEIIRVFGMIGLFGMLALWVVVALLRGESKGSAH